MIREKPMEFKFIGFDEKKVGEIRIDNNILRFIVPAKRYVIEKYSLGNFFRYNDSLWFVSNQASSSKAFVTVYAKKIGKPEDVFIIKTHEDENEKPFIFWFEDDRWYNSVSRRLGKCPIRIENGILFLIDFHLYDLGELGQGKDNGLYELFLKKIEEWAKNRKLKKIIVVECEYPEFMKKMGYKSIRTYKRDEWDTWPYQDCFLKAIG